MIVRRRDWASATCGRVCLSSDKSEIKSIFSIQPHRPVPNVALSWNVAPTDPFPVARYDAKVGERSLDVMRRDLVTFWAKGIKVGFASINGRAEWIEDCPAFPEAFQRALHEPNYPPAIIAFAPLARTS